MRKIPNPKKLHHFVPKFYLNHFGTDTDNDQKKLYIKKISGGNVFSNVTKKTGAENDFHTLDDDPYFEDVLMRYEEQWATIHNKIIDQKSINNLTDFERKKYSQFIGFLVVRTASYRDWALLFAKLAISDAMSSRPSQNNKVKNINIFSDLSAVLPEVILRIKEHVDSNPKYSSLNIDFSELHNNLQKEIAPILKTGILSGRYKVDIQNDYGTIIYELKKAHILKMEEIGNAVANTIHGMRWILNENQTDELLITSDNPVGALPLNEIMNNKCMTIEDVLKWVLNIKGKVDWYLSDGKPNPDMTILFPLTPTLILLGGYGSGLCSHENKLCIKDSGIIDTYNTIIVLQAKEFLYSKSKEFKKSNYIDISNQINRIIKNITTNTKKK